MSDQLYMPVKKDDGRYENPADWSSDDIVKQGYSKWKIPDKLEFFKMRLGFQDKDNSNIPGVTSSSTAQICELDQHLPINKEDYKKLNNPPKDGIQVMWIGHASMIVQFDGITILTDPVFSYRCSPVQLKGTGCPRFREAPCSVSDLPKIDAVLISHDHYDHLDYHSVKDLNDRFGAELHWFVPEGLKSWFQAGRRWGIIGRGLNCKTVTELTWWEEKQPNIGRGFKFICTPTQHWCQRGLNDMNKSLWCSWIVKSSRYSFYFAGDTGYCPAFKQIGEKYGPFDVAAIPIGAYEPRWYMSPQHVSPEQAVKIFQDINRMNDHLSSTVGETNNADQTQPIGFVPNFIGIHWGTFKQLGCYEPYLEPPKLVEETMRKSGIPLTCFPKVRHGDVITINAAKDLNSN